jgi:hypothetical protein
MRKQFYTDLTSQLGKIRMNADGSYTLSDTGEAAIKHFDRWNQQTEYTEESPPFACPAVFVELLPIQWKVMVEGKREAAVRVTLHVVMEQYNSSHEAQVLAFYDLLDAINKCLYSFVQSYCGTLTPESSEEDSDLSTLLHNVETYSCRVVDSSACTETQTTPANQVTVRITT